MKINVCYWIACPDGQCGLPHHHRRHGGQSVKTPPRKDTVNSQPKTSALSTACLLGAMLISSAVAQPIITNQPSDVSVSLGADVTFQVSAKSAAPPLSYLWRSNDLQLLSATNRSLIVTNVQLSSAGAYAVVVADSSGSLTSRVARLEVDPTFTKITTGRIVNDGGGSLGCAWGDYDDDGFIDLFVTNAGDQKNFLYHNDRNGTFTRITTGAIANDAQDWRGCAWADFDNDGNLDLVVTSTDYDLAQALLYHNNGNGTFTRMSNKTVAVPVPSNIGSGAQGAVWADYDNDGFVDLFVARYGIDWLYHNDGNGSFTSITNNLVGTATQFNNFAAWADYNNDGRPDLFIPVSLSEPHANRFYSNLGGGSFAQVTSGSIVDGGANPGGCAWGDYDNDGYADFFLVNGSLLSGGNNVLYHNNGDGTFRKMTSDVAGSIASDAGGFDQCAWGDYDNDGFLDLFVTTTVGWDGQNPGPNYLYHNNGDGSFTRILMGSPVNDIGASAGCVWGDYDNDGFLDLFVAKGGGVHSEHNALYRNNGNSNHWLKVKCVGTLSNRSAIGAKVRAKATIDGKAIWQLREISGGSGWSQNALDAHFGLGTATNVDTLQIEWPSGIVQTLTNVASKQFLTVVEHQENATGEIRFTEVERLTTGAIQLSASGDLGPCYLFETSTNLVNWTKLGARTNVNGTVELLDSKATNFHRRFYRSSAP
jgi:enediyne biosynthesis protein E4